MTDSELIEALARRAMGLIVYGVSGHRPQTRPLPHAWRWRRAEGTWLMIYDGSANRRWDPIENPADRAELAAALLSRGLTLEETEDPRTGMQSVLDVLPEGES